MRRICIWRAMMLSTRVAIGTGPVACDAASGVCCARLVTDAISVPSSATVAVIFMFFTLLRAVLHVSI